MSTLTKLTAAAVALVVLAMMPTGAAWAQVKVTSAVPAEASQGTVSLDVTVNGSGFNNSAAVRFLVAGTSDTGGVTVQKVTFKSSKQLVATIDVAVSASVNKFDIEVALSDGRKGKGTTLFTVLKKAATASDPCIGAQSRLFPSLAFTKQASIQGVTTSATILADATAQCERALPAGSSSAFNSDLSFRYDEGSQGGVIVRSAAGFSQQATRVNVTFDVSGVPTVQASTYTTILNASDLPIPPELLSTGWSLLSIGSGYISPVGTALLLQMTLSDSAGQQLQVFWICPFDIELLAVDRGSCRDVYRGNYADYATSNWSARGEAIYILQAAASGSGTGLYRLTLSDGRLEQIWSRGTLWTFARSSLDSSLHERVAVYEADLSSRCARALVVDTGTCFNNECLVLNGAGHPVRGVIAWLPDGRVVSDGQTAPNRRGQCSSSGSITAFDSNDTTGSTTTLVTDGVSPHGAGGD